MVFKIIGRKRRKISVLKRLLRNDEGAVAIEFAAVAFPFFLLIIATIETAIVFMAGMSLEHGMQRTARFVQTGQAVIADMSQDDFKTMVCDNAVMLPDCVATINVDVRKFDDFTSATFPPMTLPNGNPLNSADYQYDIGTSEETVVVRFRLNGPFLPRLSIQNWGI